MVQSALLGRDGVILQPRPGGICSLDEMQVIPGSLEAIARLNHAGFHVLITSNQPAMEEGRLGIETLNAIHARLNELLARAGGHVDALLVCPHRPEQACDCRKPATGMFREISQRLDISLKDIPMIGDDPADIEAALEIGANPLLVATGHGRTTHQVFPDLPLFDDLTHAVSWLLDRP